MRTTKLQWAPHRRSALAAAGAAAALVAAASTSWACTYEAGQTQVVPGQGEVGSTIVASATGAYPGESGFILRATQNPTGNCYDAAGIPGVEPQTSTFPGGVIAPTPATVPDASPGILRFCWGNGTFYTAEATFMVVIGGVVS